MRSSPHGSVVGNCKMRGKLSKTLACGCCDLRNFKWRERLKQAYREIKNGI